MMITMGKDMWRRPLLGAAFALCVFGAAYAEPEEETAAPMPTPPEVAPSAPFATTPPAPAAPPPRLNSPRAVTPQTSTRAPAPAGGTGSATAVGNNEILLNFQGADIQAVVKALSQMTGRNFLLDPRVKGQITIISAKPVSRYSAYQIFLSALKAQGFTAVEGPGPIVKVIPTGEAKMTGDVQKDIPRGGEQITTHVAVLQHVSATQMVPLLRPLMAPTSQLSAYDGANALIITDFADNIRRLLNIVERIDQPVSSDVTVIPVKNASALDLAELIARLATPSAGGGGQGGPGGQNQLAAGDRFTIIPDLRTNSLLIRTDNPGRLNQLRSLIEKLDVAATTGGQTRVIYLRNAEATKLAEVLRGLIAGEARTQQAASAAVAAAPGGAGGGAAAPASRSGGGGRGGAENSLIQADEATNSLIISASDAVYNNLRSVIEKLDVRRAQVFVEALIAEITNENATELGIQWADAGRAGNGVVAGVTNFPTASQPGLFGTAASPTTALANASGLTLAFLGPKITLNDGTQINTLGALARALEQRSLANILSTPNLMTLDNAEAKITVGQNVPFITGSFTNTGGAGGTVNPFQTVDRKDVGIVLRIKPQISEGGGVRLDIFQEIQTITNAARSVGAADLITNKRSVETKVLVDDGNTIVLGGLIEDSAEETRQEVPFLGRIPLLGALFRSKETNRRKTNLMVFLRPTIVRSADDGFRLTTDRYEHIRASGKETDRERAKILERLQPIPPLPPKPAPEPKDSSKETPKDSKETKEPQDNSSSPVVTVPPPPG